MILVLFGIIIAMIVAKLIYYVQYQIGLCLIVDVPHTFL